MANGIYKLSKQNYDFAGMTTDPVRAILTRSYAPDYTLEEFLTSIPAPSRVAIQPASMTNKTFTLGVFDADTVTFPSVPAGALCDYIVFVVWTGVDATTRLLAALNTGFTGLPVTPTGTDIIVNWAPGGIWGL